jgi:hypothetical protein
VERTLSFPKPATAQPPAPDPGRRPVPEASKRSGGSNVPAYVAGGIGLAGLAFGSAMGIVALVKFNDLECEGNDCVASEEPKADTVNTYATLSTIGFAVGATGVATSAILFWVAPASSGEGSARALDSVAFGAKGVF